MNRQGIFDTDLLNLLPVPHSTWDHQSLDTPDWQGAYPRHTRAYVRLDLSFRVYWHTLYDVCPELIALSGQPDGLPIFRPFMAWAEELQLSFNWTFYLWVYRWLLQSEFCTKLTPEIVHRLIAASAARWAVMDRSINSGIVIGGSDFPEVFAGWKQHAVDGRREVELIELDELLPKPAQWLGCFTVPQFELDLFPGWSDIPQ
jgi:uncharacterized repeat protein (TIGR04061 family)